MDRRPPRRAPRWMLALFGWMSGTALLAWRDDGAPVRRELPGGPPHCTLEPRAPPPPLPSPREWRSARGIGETRALAIARALWDAGADDPLAFDLEGVPGIGPVTAARARAWVAGCPAAGAGPGRTAAEHAVHCLATPPCAPTPTPPPEPRPARAGAGDRSDGVQPWESRRQR